MTFSFKMFQCTSLKFTDLFLHSIITPKKIDERFLSCHTQSTFRFPILSPVLPLVFHNCSSWEWWQDIRKLTSTDTEHVGGFKETMGLVPACPKITRGILGTQLKSQTLLLDPAWIGAYIKNHSIRAWRLESDCPNSLLTRWKTLNKFISLCFSFIYLKQKY